MKSKKKSRGKTISVSPKAHEIISKNAFNSKPRRKMREHINIINKLPAEA